jgi:hypothetical protein
MGSGVAPQCSRNRCLPRADGLIPPSWPPRWSRSSELEEGPGHGPDPRFPCPSGVLELELRHTPTSGEPSDETNEDEVDEGSQGAGMLTTSVN